MTQIFFATTGWPWSLPAKEYARGSRRTERHRSRRRAMIEFLGFSDFNESTRWGWLSLKSVRLRERSRTSDPALKARER